jgi:hypothetical protein
MHVQVDTGKTDDSMCASVLHTVYLKIWKIFLMDNYQRTQNISN